MFEQFTEKSIKAMLLAEDEARRMGHSQFGTEHILLGLLREGNGNAAQALKRVDVTLKEARLEVQRIAPPGQAPAKEGVYTPATYRLLGAAVREAQKFEVDYISTEFLLLGLLADNHYDNRAFRVLEHFKIDLTNLGEELSRTATTESIFNRQPATKRPWKRQPVTDETAYEALREALNRAKAQTKSEKEAADNRLNQAFADVLSSLRKAADAAVSEQRPELAAWLYMQDQNWVGKFEQEGLSIFELGKMVKYKYAEVERMWKPMERFSLPAMQVLGLAKSESQRLGHTSVGTEHVLIALMSEGGGDEATVVIKIGGKEHVSTPSERKNINIAAKVFGATGVTVDEVRAEVQKLVTPDGGTIMAEPPLSPEVQHLFDRAREVAQKSDPEGTSSPSQVAIEHLLLALIQEIEEQRAEVAKNVLANRGIEVNKLKEHIQRLEPDARLIAGLVAPNIIRLAEEEARLLGHDSLSTEHVFLGLVREGIGIASRSLKLVGVNIDDARTQVASIAGRGPGAQVDDMLFAPSAKRLFELSRGEAKKIGHGYLGSEHMILAMINQEDNPATVTVMKVLKALDVDIERLRYEVTSRLMNCITGETGENFMK